MENEERQPIFTKKRIIIGSVILLLLLILGYFLFFRGSAVKVERVELAQTNVSLKPGETFMLRAYVYPANASNKAIQYTTTDPTVVTVSNSGLITAVKEGNAQIVVKSLDTNIVAACDVIVSNNPDVATQLILESSEMTINKGAKKLLTITVIPDTAKVPALTFTSSDSNIVSVDNDGYIMGKNVGSATITVTGDNGTGTPLTAAIKINVVNAPANNGGTTKPVIKVESISLDKTEITVEVGKEYQFVPKIKSTGGTPSLTWKSQTLGKDNKTNNDPLVASVDNTGKVKGLLEGRAQITVSAGGKTATAIVTVVKASSTTGGGSSRDTTGPSISLSNSSTPTADGWYKDVSVSISVKDGSGVASAQYCLTSVTSSGICNTGTSIDSSATVKIPGSTFVLTVTAMDKKGNKSTKTAGPFKIDNTKPTCDFGGQIGDVVFTGQPSSKLVRIVGRDIGSGIATVSDPFGNKTTGTTKEYLIAYNGKHTASVVDKAGNTGTCSINVTGIRTDHVTPTCNITASTSSSATYVTLSINSSATDLNTVPYSWESSTSGFTTVKTKMAKENGTYKAYIRDAAGNVGSCSYTVTNIVPDTEAPVISSSLSGSKGLNDWYRNLTVKAIVTDRSSYSLKYCRTTGSSCTPYDNYPSSGVSLGNGTWRVVFTATDPYGNSNTKSFGPYKVDTVPPICTLSTSYNWETSKSIYTIGSDADSGFRRIKLWTGLYVAQQSIWSTISKDGTYTATCEDNAGNTRSASVNIIARQEYSTRTCQSCKTKAIFTYSAWNYSQKICLSSSLPYPTKAEAESKELSLYYTGCVPQSTTVNGCSVGQYLCSKYTRSHVTTYKEDCYSGCKDANWDLDTAWTPYAYTITPPINVKTATTLIEVRSRTTYAR